MKPLWKIGRIAGIAVYLHATFPLLLLWVGFYQYSQRGRLADVWSGLAFTVLLFVVVVLHELSHALVARRFGIRTRDITLLPIGGVAHLDRIPEKATQELLVALAGPAVNLGLALGIFSVLGWRADAVATGLAPAGAADFAAQFAWANLWLAGFNLLPAFPLDGGRVLRALLALRLPHLEATRIAALTGRIVAVGLGFIGLAVNPFLVLIAFFIWIGAGEEAAANELKVAMTGVHAGEVMLRECRTFAPEESLARAANHLLACCQEDFPIVDGEGRFHGLLRRADLVKGLAERGPDATVAGLMVRNVPTAQLDEPVTRLLHRWSAGRGTVAVLHDRHRFAGLLTAGNLGEYMMVQAALKRHATAFVPIPE